MRHTLGRVLVSAGRAGNALYGPYAAKKPNAEYAASLGDSEFLTYTESLRDCSRVSQESLGNVRVDTDAIDEERQRFEEVEEIVLANSSVVSAVEDWRSCMGEAGFSFQEPGEGISLLEEEFRQLSNASVQAGAPVSASDLEEFRRREVEFAPSNIGCGGGEEGLGALFDTLFDEIWEERYG